MHDEIKAGNEPDIYKLGAFDLVHNFNNTEFQFAKHC